jgi:hypothetical protein
MALECDSGETPHHCGAADCGDAESDGMRVVAGAAPRRSGHPEAARSQKVLLCTLSLAQLRCRSSACRTFALARACLAILSCQGLGRRYGS